MAFGPQDARLRFLEASARHYAATAPAISAHLMLQRNLEVVGREIKVVKGSASPACQSCVTIMIPGWTSKITIENEGAVGKGRSGKRSARKGREEKDKKLVFECLACHRYVKTDLDFSRRPRKGARGAKALLSTSQATAAISKPKSAGDPQKAVAANSGSKQRAKARKGGLQAMLEKSKQSSTPSVGRGLGLMDLMKQG